MNILIGISGGVAAYKSCELLRLFQKAGHDIKVVLTQNAQKFVTEKTFESLLEGQVYTQDWFANTKGNAHIQLARWADVFIIAPATANTLYKCAQGKADDFLSTVYLAFDKKAYLAPAMNTVMLEDPAVQRNITLLKDKGEMILDPSSGELACKEVGVGKMMEPEDIFRLIFEDQHGSSKLFDQEIVVTAGATREYIDPVRFLSSPSTGNMGVEIAKQAHQRGAKVLLIHGPIDVKYSGRTIEVVSAKQMYDAVESNMPCDFFVSTAAVADYRPEKQHDQKIKKENEELQISLVRNPDILSYVSRKNYAKKMTIGFSAETNDVIAHAQQKLQNKNLDMIVANEVFQSEKGFGNHSNQFHILSKTQQKTFDDMNKEVFAKVFWDEVEAQL